MKNHTQVILPKSQHRNLETLGLVIFAAESTKFGKVARHIRMAGAIYVDVYDKLISSKKVIGTLTCLEDVDESLLS